MADKEGQLLNFADLRLTRHILEKVGKTLEADGELTMAQGEESLISATANVDSALQFLIHEMSSGTDNALGDQDGD